MDVLRSRTLLPSLAIAYVALWFVVGLLTPEPSDLDIFFWPSALTALAGHPLLVYSHSIIINTATGPQTFFNDDGPLSLVPLIAIGWLLRAFGSLGSVSLMHAFTFATFSIFTLLMAREAIHLLERLRGHSLTPLPRLYAYAFLLLTTPIWQSLLGYGHIEQPLEVWLLLLTLRYLDLGLSVRAGLCFGLALLTRSTAVLFVIPLLFATLPYTPKTLLRAAATSLLVCLLGFLPLYLADSAGLVHALFGYRTNVPIYGGSIWLLLRSTWLGPWGQTYDVVFVALAALIANLALIWRVRAPSSLRLVAGFALSAACFTLLVKTLWPYYFFGVFVFASIFFFARYSLSQRRAWLALPPLYVCLLGLLAEVGVSSATPNLLVSLESLAMFLLLLAGCLGVIWVAHRPTSRLAPVPKTAGRSRPL